MRMMIEGGALGKILGRWSRQMSPVGGRSRIGGLELVGRMGLLMEMRMKMGWWTWGWIFGMLKMSRM